MKKIGTINIEGKTYPFSFKMKSRRLFMETYNLSYLDEYDNKIKEMIPDTTGKWSINQLYIFATLVYTAIQAEASEAIPFDTDDLLDVLIEDHKQMQTILSFFTDSSEQAEKSDKQAKKKKVSA